MRRRSLIASSLVLLALGGCGGFGGDDDVTENVSGPALLTKRQVERQPAGSPQRAVFEWWRALQFKNAAEAAPYFSPSLKITPERLTRFLQAADDQLNTRPRLVDTETSGDKAIVRLLLERYSRNPNGRVDKTRKAQAFNVVREGGQWKLADNLYLDAIYRQYREFTAPLRQKSKSG